MAGFLEMGFYKWSSYLKSTLKSMAFFSMIKIHYRRRDGYPAMCIHGDKQQKERDWVLNEFRRGSTSILVATDVAARGLDVDDVKFVINYDYPNNSEDYIHRIGRTGRKDQTGTAYTLFTPANGAKAKDLVNVLSEAKQVVNPKLQELAQCSGFHKRAGGRFGGGGGGRMGGGGMYNCIRIS